MVNISGPMSADVYSHQQRAVIPQQKLDAHWQPRSASALDNHTRPSEDSQRSWIDYGDYGDEEEDVILDYRRPSSDEQDLSQEGSESIYHDEDPNIYSTYAHDQNQDVEDVDVRSTQFFDAEDSDGEGSTEKANRYSVWSAKSRMSILDGERSGDVRQKFVQRVEAMYGKSTIPPVPKLPSPKSRPGMF
ncbi:hypothetical protein EUX98_g1501 [Antrodiella citrinella]|uniref:Uncharacterized protein n=1 Tax=Antrodiella citrinella TaxID=2447956 RepID=A0A4S4N1A5_9APHY|nr:hypothetical protein EUX98_g1501 [Antrodiella citrinella]